MADAQVVNTSFISVSKANLDSVSIIDGQLIRIKDEPGLYYDMNGKRYNVTDKDWISVDALPETGESSKVYYVPDEVCAYIYVQDAWFKLADATQTLFMKALIDGIGSTPYKYNILMLTGTTNPNTGIPIIQSDPLMGDSSTIAPFPDKGYQPKQTLLRTGLVTPNSAQGGEIVNLSDECINICTSNGYIRRSAGSTSNPVYLEFKVSNGDRIIVSSTSIVHISGSDMTLYAYDSSSASWKTSKLSDTYEGVRFYSDIQTAISDYNSSNFSNGSVNKDENSVCSIDRYSNCLKLLKDTSISSILTISKSINIDMNGFELNCGQFYISCTTADADINIYSNNKEYGKVVSEGSLCNFVLTGLNSIRLSHLNITNSNRQSGTTFNGNMSANSVSILDCSVSTSSNTGSAVNFQITGADSLTITDSNFNAYSLISGNYYARCLHNVKKTNTDFQNVNISGCQFHSDYSPNVSSAISTAGIIGIPNTTGAWSIKDCNFIFDQSQELGDSDLFIYGLVSYADTMAIENCRMIDNTNDIGIASINVASGDSLKIVNCNIQHSYALQMEGNLDMIDTQINMPNRVCKSAGIHVKGDANIDNCAIHGYNSALQSDYSSKVTIQDSILYSPWHVCYVGAGPEGSFEAIRCKFFNTYDQYTKSFPDELSNEDLKPHGAIYLGHSQEDGAGKGTINLYNCSFINPSRKWDANNEVTSMVLKSSDNYIAPTVNLYSCRLESFRTPIRVDSGGTCNIYEGTEYVSYTMLNNNVASGGNLNDYRVEVTIQDLINSVNNPQGSLTRQLTINGNEYITSYTLKVDNVDTEFTPGTPVDVNIGSVIILDCVLAPDAKFDSWRLINRSKTPTTIIGNSTWIKFRMSDINMELFPVAIEKS